MQEIEQAYHQYAILIVKGFYDILYYDDFADMARQSAAEKQEVQGSLQKIENLSQAYTRADSQQEKESIRNQFKWRNGK